MTVRTSWAEISERAGGEGDEEVESGEWRVDGPKPAFLSTLHTLLVACGLKPTRPAILHGHEPHARTGRGNGARPGFGRGRKETGCDQTLGRVGSFQRGPMGEMSGKRSVSGESRPREPRLQL